jgi:hypothetical protein
VQRAPFVISEVIALVVCDQVEEGSLGKLKPSPVFWQRIEELAGERSKARAQVAQLDNAQTF